MRLPRLVLAEARLRPPTQPLIGVGNTSYLVLTTYVYVVSSLYGLRFAVESTSSPRQDRLFIWPPFFLYNKRLLRQKTGAGACLYIMPQDGHWLASFEVIPLLKS